MLDWDIPKSDADNFYRVVYQSGCNESDLTDFLREIQKNSFYSELPEFNYLSLSAENVEYIPLTAEKFIDKFFSHKGALLQEYIEAFESAEGSTRTILRSVPCGIGIAQGLIYSFSFFGIQNILKRGSQ